MLLQKVGEVEIDKSDALSSDFVARKHAVWHEVGWHLQQAVFLVFLMIVGALLSIAVEEIETRKWISSAIELSLLKAGALSLTIAGVITTIWNVIVFTIISLTQGWNSLMEKCKNQ